MSRIYHESYVTLAAVMAADASEGCFAVADPKYVPKSLRFSTSASESCNVTYNAIMRSKKTKGILDERAWVLQETLLSPRTVRFLEQELVWECRQASACESSEFYDDSVTKVMHSYNGLTSSSSDIEMERCWETIVQAYTKRALSYSSDIFPALQGLAATMPSRMGDYLAGHWRNTLPQSLRWSQACFSSVATRPSVRRPAEWRAPTWSWASICAAVRWPGSAGSLCQVWDAETTLKGNDPSGQLLSGKLTLKGQYLMGTVHYNSPDSYGRPREPSVVMTINKYVIHERVNWDYDIRLEEQHHVPHGSAVMVLKLASLPNLHYWLILRASDADQQTHERLGLMSRSVSIDLMGSNRNLGRDNWDRQLVACREVEVLDNAAEGNEIVVTII